MRFFLGSWAVKNLPSKVLELLAGLKNLGGAEILLNTEVHYLVLYVIFQCINIKVHPG